MRSFSNVAIVGAGLIGTSIALTLRARAPGIEVALLDRDDDVHRAAAADLIVLSAPVLANHERLESLKGRVGAGTLITDTGSTKALTLSVAGGLRFIGGHPIAGSAQAGPAHARPHLFDGCHWILTPEPATDADDLQDLTGFVERLGAKPVIMNAVEHDRLFARISHVPQLVISALMDVIGRGSGADNLRFAGAGLRDSTRLADSPPDIWLDVMATNRAEIRRALDELIERLVALRDDADGTVLRRTFEEARRWKDVLQAGERTDA